MGLQGTHIGEFLAEDDGGLIGCRAGFRIGKVNNGFNIPAWAWKFKDKSILVSVLLVGAFFVELLIPLLSPSIDRFTMVTFFSVIISLLYVGCAAVPVLAAFAEDQE